jgi:hypothetical protein
MKDALLLLHGKCSRRNVFCILDAGVGAVLRSSWQFARQLLHQMAEIISLTCVDKLIFQLKGKCSSAPLGAIRQNFLLVSHTNNSARRSSTSYNATYYKLCTQHCVELGTNPEFLFHSLRLKIKIMY